MYGYGYSPYFINTFLSARGGVPYSYLVDTYSPTAAYSLRKLSSSATNAIRVRRSSDNAEQDIGFSGNDLDTASLSSFCSGTDGFVVKWYNQGAGGATYDASQASTAAQNQIVSSGAVITSPSNGLSASVNVGTNDAYAMTAISFSSDHCEFFVFDRPTASTLTFLGRFSSALNTLIYWDTSNNLRSQWGGTSVTQFASDTSTGGFLVSSFRVQSTGAVTMYKNNTAGAGGNTGTTTSNYSRLLGGSGAGGTGSEGYFQEMIIFDTNESANRTAIESDINGYYSIY